MAKFRLKQKVEVLSIKMQDGSIKSGYVIGIKAVEKGYTLYHSSMASYIKSLSNFEYLVSVEYIGKAETKWYSEDQLR